MSLDIFLRCPDTNETLWEKNMPHSLRIMASEAMIYTYLWHPDKADVKIASDLIDRLTVSLDCLVRHPDFFKKFNPKQQWGDYEYLVSFVEDYLQACIENPEATIHTA